MKFDPRLVIFDCDGVLVDSEPISMRVLLETVTAAGGAMTEDEAYDRLLGRSLKSAREILAADYGVDLDEPTLDEMRDRLYAAFRAELKPIAGVADAIGLIARPFCVASSSQPDRIELSLRVAGLWPLFDGRAFSSTMVARGKPAPDLFLHAAREMGVRPQDCLVIEDSPAGIEAAHAAGMSVIGFFGGGHARGQAHRAAIEALKPHRTITSMADLPGLLEPAAA